MSRVAFVLALVIAVSGTLPAGAAESANLGRLFFTPERRLSLERQRTHHVQQAQALQGTTMSLDGVVYRSSGKSTVWINQHAQNENDARRTGVSAKLSPRDPGRALIAPGEDTPADLKVGEAVNRATGERNTRLGGGQVLTPVPPSRNPR
ncbi:MAG: hypothetical protein KA179_12720 [Sulfuritalea sp.]|nr:hypothetical protein [Sulfuritalea sp.]